MSLGRIESAKIWLIAERSSNTALEVCPNTTLDPKQSVSAWVRDNLQLTPDDLQSAFFNATEKRIILLCTRQWGKSTIAAAKALHHALTTPKAFILVASASKRQSIELVLKFNEFAQMVLGKPPRTQGESFRLPNGARIIPLPESPKKVRCYSAPTLLIIDEAAFVSDALYEALTPALATSNGALWLLSTAYEQKGFFYQACATPPGIWKLVKATAADCPRISPEFLAAERATKGETYYMREYCCEFRAGRSQFVDDAALDAIFDGTFEIWKD